MKDRLLATRLTSMLDFDVEEGCDDEPGVWAKLITLAGLAIFWIWVLVLIF